MSLDCVGNMGALDNAAEVEELHEFMRKEPEPELPEDELFESSLESAPDEESLDTIVGVEVKKAGEVVGLTHSSLAAAEKVAGTELFKAERKELKELQVEFATLESIEAASPETLTTLAEEPRIVKIHEIEITGLNEPDTVLTERAADIAYMGSEKAKSLDETPRPYGRGIFYSSSFSCAVACPMSSCS